MHIYPMHCNVLVYALDAHPSKAFACLVDGGHELHDICAKGMKEKVKIPTIRSQGLEGP